MGAIAGITTLGFNIKSAQIVAITEKKRNNACRYFICTQCILIGLFGRISGVASSKGDLPSASDTIKAFYIAPKSETKAVTEITDRKAKINAYTNLIIALL